MEDTHADLSGAGLSAAPLSVIERSFCRLFSIFSTVSVITPR
jgi:hypothetical protein